MGFIHENFLLESETARYLYRQYASGQPILDYHCHISPKDIAEDRRFNNLFEIWLEGDHYKWRAMRANGVPERYCTGNAAPFEKFQAWAKTVPHTLRNPLYHWTHLELLRYFDVSDLLDEKTAPHIWTEAEHRLKSDELSAQGILANFRVRAICTTDDPADSLEYHERIEASGSATSVLPTFRPDAAMDISNPAHFTKWVGKLGQSCGLKISRFSDFVKALELRHDYFHRRGCRLSDHGLDFCPVGECNEAQAAAVFDLVRGGTAPSPLESEMFASYLMMLFGRLDAEKGWTKQLHLGAYRNVNSRALAKMGRDSGFDSIADLPQVASLATYLDRLDQANALPKMIIYNANPADNYAFATLVGNFHDGKQASKLQFGSGWWFLDQKEAIEWQLNALSNCGLLSNFVGMLTDSRSFMSYPRHEYFRRVLCNLLGSEMEKGLLPDDESLIGGMISRICYANAARFLDLPSVQDSIKPAPAAVSAIASPAAVRGGGTSIRQAEDS